MSCVYQIKCKDPKITETYVGSTVDLKQRIRQHRYKCIEGNNECWLKIYVFMRENGGFDNFEFNILEEFTDISKEQLRDEEQKYIKQITPQLNKKNASVTPEELKEYHRKYSKEYKHAHKEQCNQYNKKYYREHKEERREIKRQTDKLYYEKNKEKIKADSKARYEKNKEKIEARASAPWTCEICNVTVRRDSKPRHERSELHKSKIKSNIQNCTNNEQ